MHALAERRLAFAREAGAVASLPDALGQLAALSVHAGDFAGAAAMIDEAAALTRATGSPGMAHGHLVLAAWLGQEARVAELVEAATQDATLRGEGMTVTLGEYATAVLENGHGRYGPALAAAQRAYEHDEHALGVWAPVELIEAAVRSGERAVARAALDRLSERARLSGTHWALGIEARSRALLSDGRAAEELYLYAIEQLGRSRGAAHLARAHLLYGEWLRRERRRVEARRELRTAHEMLASMGAEAFAARAERELLATGERARKRTAETTSDLTAQETQVARLAREGRSNPQIGAQLFISPRTVEYHLSKVFTKLGIGSRNELGRALPFLADGVAGGVGSG
jgi:DNA-binding CsgD family transcriptional regulator